MAKIRVVETKELPFCPHCGQELQQINRVSKGIFEQVIAFSCPYCRKLLSVGYNVGW